jgi:hypothetical protein
MQEKKSELKQNPKGYHFYLLSLYSEDEQLG